MKLQEILNHSVGDIITLSDIQTQIEYKKTNVDFVITEKREYNHPENLFKYTAFIASYDPDKTDDIEAKDIMVLVREIGNDYNLRLFYLDNCGLVENFEPLFCESEDDLIDRFEVDLHFGDENLPVTWDKQDKTNFGIETYSTEFESSQCKTIAEYFTNDDTKGNPHCFIEWSGDKEDGFVEMWYGCDIEIFDVDFYKTKRS